MSNEKIEFHQRFLDTFTLDELDDIVINATAVSSNCIVVSTVDNFFELSADIGDKLDIHCDWHSNVSSKKLTKDEFMILLKSSLLMETKNIEIDE